MNRIFISYRRDDTAGHAGRLFDRLGARLGKDSVFMDVEGIEAGLDFVETIEAAVGSCDVLLAVIGRGWLDMKDSQGKPRLEDPHDFIRLETATALARHIRVIPVLVEGAVMPPQESLPDILQPLTRRQAVELRDSRWEADIENLIQVLEKVLVTPMPASRATASGADKPGPVEDKPADKHRRPIALWVGVGTSLIVAGGVIGFLMSSNGREHPLESPSPPVVMKAPVRPDATPQAPSPLQPAATMPTAATQKTGTPASDRTRQTARQDAAPPPVRKQTLSAKSGPTATRTASVSPTTTITVPTTRNAPAKPPSTVEIPAHSAQPPIQAAVLPPVTATVKAVKIAIIALGEPTSRSFWDGESEPGYSAKMTTLYGGTLRELVRSKIDVHAGTDHSRVKPLMEGSPKLDRELCESTGASAIFVALARQGFTISQAESAYWPELRLGAIACASGQRHVSRYSLSPRQGEAFPFAQDMAQAMTGFVRENLYLMQ